MQVRYGSGWPSPSNSSKYSTSPCAICIAKGGCTAFEIFTVKKIHVLLLLHLLLPVMFGDTQNLQVCDITLFKARMAPVISHMFIYTGKL